MRRQIILITLILFTAIRCGQSSNNPLVGSWVMKDGQVTITYTFTEDTFTAIREKDLGEFGKQSWTIKGKYVISQDKVILTSDDGQEKIYIFSVDKNSLNLNGVIYAKAGSELTTLASTEKIYTPQLHEEDPNIILVEGNPPLKQKIINLYFRFFEFLTRTNLTEAEKKQLKEDLIAEFKRGNKAERDDLLRFEERWQKINALPSEQKEVVRVQLVKGITAEAQKNPDNLEGKILLEIMGKVNKVLVPGEPPLTQQTVDAYLEMVAFLVSIDRGEEFYITQEMKQNATKRLIKLFKKFPIEEKRKMAELDINWATFRMVWQEASDLQKIQFKQLLKQSFSEKETKSDEMPTISMENLSKSKEGAPKEKFYIYMPGLYNLGTAYTPPGLFRGFSSQ